MIFIFVKNARGPRPGRDRDFSNTTIISTTVVAEGRPPWRSIIWNESTRDRSTWHTTFQCGTVMVPHAYCYVRPRPEPEIALERGRAHDRPRKSQKTRTSMPVLPPQLPIQFHPSPSSQPTTNPSRDRLKGGFLHMLTNAPAPRQPLLRWVEERALIFAWTNHCRNCTQQF